jgi:MFS transporter, BCD family, chlorophyll transporter
VALIGFGSGLFSVATLTMAMDLQVPLSAAVDPDGRIGHGLALGAWGAVQATASGAAIALGGALRDIVSSLATQGVLGTALASPGTGYSVVYHLEIGLLFVTLVAIGPLVRSGQAGRASSTSFGLAEFPS